MGLEHFGEKHSTGTREEDQKESAKSAGWS